MGCGSGQKEAGLPVRLSTITGKLKITITNAVIMHKVSSLKMDPYFIIRLSNQVHQSKVIINGDMSPSFMETFVFYINSCYKSHGRNLEITLMDKKKVLADGEIGYGIVDLDPVINFKKPKDEFRCFVNYDRKQAGFINIIAEFEEETSQTINFRFETASIRRKTSTLTNMNCWVRVTIGEEVLSTNKKKDTKELPPVWDKDILTFNAPAGVKEAEVVVLDDDEEVGRVMVELSKLFEKKDEQAWNLEFSHNHTNAGTLKFQTISGVNPTFSPIKSDHKKEQEKPNTQETPKIDNTVKVEPKTEEVKKEQRLEEPKAKDEAKTNQNDTTI